MPKPVISHNLYIHLNIKMRQALEHKNRILSMRLDYSRTTFRLRMLRFDTLDDRQDRCLLDNYSIRRCLESDPNIEGGLQYICGGTPSGAFSTVNQDSKYDNGTGNTQRKLTFRASDGNSIYVSDKVQPASLQALCCIKF